MSSKIKAEEKAMENFVKRMELGHEPEPLGDDFDDIESNMALTVMDPRGISADVESVDIDQNVRDDYVTARDNLLHLIEQSQEFLKAALEHAKTAPSSRAIEVCTGAMKQISELSQQLNDVNRDYKELTGAGTNPNAQSVSNGNINNVWMGSPEDLNDILNGKTKDVIDE